jgi:diadenosine tetraphosphate (Ap4A) HIT family hydrolase
VTVSPDVASDQCPFCAIARGEDASVEIVCEGEAWVAFFPDKPATAGHTLVIPRVHVPDLWSADSSVAAELISGVIRVGRAINKALTPSGMNLISSSGEEAEQTIYHLHLHVVPRYREDALGHIWPPKRELPGIDLEGVADRIRDACRSVQERSVRAEDDDHEHRRRDERPVVER